MCFCLCLLCREELGQARNRLLDGLKKLNETNNLVASMKADLARLQPELESKAASTAELLVKVCICKSTAMGTLQLITISLALLCDSFGRQEL